jgi:hypothetical protein
MHKFILTIDRYSSQLKKIQHLIEARGEELFCY